ncbi:hypothetical protein CLU79DRAFT_749889 [Phycomyces nitens]|nr:hypothetical protein CLU79DRAFT_749889 [Phycomyces nitens]
MKTTSQPVNLPELTNVFVFYMQSIRRHWTWSSWQYPLIITLLAFDIAIIQAPPLAVRIILACLFLTSLTIPYVRRFVLPALPIFTWLITFYACQFIPLDYRPKHIFVNILPTLERILYGSNLSEIISKHTHWTLDLLAWLPYGVIHFAFPFVLSLLLFVFGPPSCLKLFGSAFGFMNIAGVLTQLCFPNASPWYENIYGSSPADYSIKGEAGGLSRIDDILGLQLYGSTFGNSPLVFGAFPSLHSGCATIEMLFLFYLCPRLWPVCIAYTMWMWWATMYLTHHYMIDLVGGSIYALIAFCIARPYLPTIQPNARTRLAYYGIEKLSLSAFVRSIEYMGDPADSESLRLKRQDDEESRLMKRNIQRAMVDMDGEMEEILVLPLETERVPLRLRRLDYGLPPDEKDDGLASPVPTLCSSTSTPACSEPSSPTVSQTPIPPLHFFAK